MINLCEMFGFVLNLCCKLHLRCSNIVCFSTVKLVAISDQPHMPNLHMPIGNKHKDYELGVVIHIYKDHQAYVFNLTEYFYSMGITFKVILILIIMLFYISVFKLVGVLFNIYMIKQYENEYAINLSSNANYCEVFNAYFNVIQYFMKQCNKWNYSI